MSMIWRRYYKLSISLINRTLFCLNSKNFGNILRCQYIVVYHLLVNFIILVLCQCSFDGCRSSRFILEKAQTKVWTPTSTRQKNIDRVLGSIDISIKIIG